MKWTSLAALVAGSLGLVVPSGALAAGGPVAPVQGTAIGVFGSPDRYAAVSARGDTIVKRLPARGRRAASELRVRGRYGVPGVDFNGGTTGLSADGRTLVLAELPGSYPPRTSRLLVLDAPRLAVRARLALPGWSTVDAISPNGRWLYLIHYTSSNATDYEVLAYDLLARRMLVKPIVDPRDREEEMTGIPVSRVMSADGRWAYTFYMRPSGVPFVHALDTSGLRAVCIDLPSLANGDLGSAHLRLLPGGTTLGIETDAGYQAQIDTRTFAVRTAANPFVPAPVTPGPRPHRRAGASGDTQWTVIALAVALLGVLAAAAAVAGRRPRTRPSRVGEVTDAPSGAVGHWVVEEGREPPVVDFPLVSGDVPRSRG